MGDKFMFTITIATAIVLTLGCLAFLMSRNMDPDQLVQRRAEPLTMGVQIICGDCSGEDRRPVRTLLDRRGRCAQCGGASYVLASIVGSYGAQMRAELFRGALMRPRSARVIPFKARASRAPHTKKIAV